MANIANHNSLNFLCVDAVFTYKQSMEIIINYLRSLALNNNREWFNDNKKKYVEALDLFRVFAGEVLTGIARFDPLLGDLEIINDPLIKKGYERTGKDDMLKKGPAGFPKDFEHLDEIRYKHYIFSKNYSESEIRKKDFSTKLAVDFRGLLPLVNYLNHAMSFTGNE